MCSMEKGKITSCQITYFPIKSEKYLEEINSVLEIIKSYPVESEVGILSTTIRGERNVIFQLIDEIYNTMDQEGCHFTMNIMMSNICGCDI